MRREGFTIIEIIVALVVVAIIAVVSVAGVVSMVQLMSYLPGQARSRVVGQGVTDSILDGEAEDRGTGLKYAARVKEAAYDYVVYEYGYPKAVSEVKYRWSDTANKIYRSTRTPGQTTWSAEKAIPKYITEDVNVKKRGSYLFTYKKKDDTSDWIPGTDKIKDIGRVQVNMEVTKGAGLFSRFESKLDITSSAKVYPRPVTTTTPTTTTLPPSL